MSDTEYEPRVGFAGHRAAQAAKELVALKANLAAAKAERDEALAEEDLAEKMRKQGLARIAQLEAELAQAERFAEARTRKDDMLATAFQAERDDGVRNCIAALKLERADAKIAPEYGPGLRLALGIVEGLLEAP